MIDRLIPRVSKVWLLAASMLLTGEHCMARSLILPAPETLVGTWRLYPQDDSNAACELRLSTQAPALDGDLECVANWLGEGPTSWEPTPDGIWLYGAAGSGLVHLNRQEDGLYEARLQNGKTLMLVRKST